MNFIRVDAYYMLFNMIIISIDLALQTVMI